MSGPPISVAAARTIIMVVVALPLAAIAAGLWVCRAPLWAWLLYTGILAGLLRAWRDHGQDTWSRETVMDAVIGGAAACLAPPLFGVAAPRWAAAIAAPHYQVIGVFIVSFVASTAWVVAVRRRLPAFFARMVDNVGAKPAPPLPPPIGDGA